MADVTEHHRPHYGRSNRPADPERCAENVWAGVWDGSAQCRRKRNPTTKDGAFCLQHCPDRKAAKDKARREKAEAKLAEWRRDAARKELATEAARLLVELTDATSADTMGKIADWRTRWDEVQS